MSDVSGTATVRKRSSKGLMIGLALALILGGGSFYAVYSGQVELPFGLDGAERAADAPLPGAEDVAAQAAPLEPVAFVPLEPMVISLGPAATAKHLKLTVQVETSPDAQATVADLTPRIADVLNTYLRAVDEALIEAPSGMLRLRAQMLRRVQLVCPPGAVRDLLIQEFVLN